MAYKAISDFHIHILRSVFAALITWWNKLDLTVISQPYNQALYIPFQDWLLVFLGRQGIKTKKNIFEGFPMQMQRT